MDDSVSRTISEVGGSSASGLGTAGVRVHTPGGGEERRRKDGGGGGGAKDASNPRQAERVQLPVATIVEATEEEDEKYSDDFERDAAVRRVVL